METFLFEINLLIFLGFWDRYTNANGKRRNINEKTKISAAHFDRRFDRFLYCLRQ